MAYAPALTADPGALLLPADPARRSAWAQLGTSVAGTGSAHEALVTAGLAGWNIRKREMTATDISEDGVTRITNPDKVMLVYTDPATQDTRYLSTVGRKYGVHQNEAGAELIDTLVAEAGASGAGYAGAIDGGCKTFVTIELPGQMRVDGVDTSLFRTYDAALASLASAIRRDSSYLARPGGRVCLGDAETVLAFYGGDGGAGGPEAPTCGESGDAGFEIVEEPVSGPEPAAVYLRLATLRVLDDDPAEPAVTYCLDAGGLTVAILPGAYPTVLITPESHLSGLPITVRFEDPLRPAGFEHTYRAH